MQYGVYDPTGNLVSDTCYTGDPDLEYGNGDNGAEDIYDPDSSPVGDTYPILVANVGSFQVNTTACPQYSGAVQLQQGTLTVVPDTPNLAFSVPSLMTAYGQVYEPTVTISNLNNVPVTGTVTFNISNPDGSPYATATVAISSGQAAWDPCGPTESGFAPCEVLSPGAYPVTVTYSGDALNSSASSSGPNALTITQSGTITTIGVSKVEGPISLLAVPDSEAFWTFWVTVVANTNGNAIPNPLNTQTDPTLQLPAAPSGSVGVNADPPGTLTPSSPYLLAQAQPYYSWAEFEYVVVPAIAPTGTLNFSAIYEGSSTTPDDNGAYPGDTNYTSSTGSCYTDLSDFSGTC